MKNLCSILFANFVLLITACSDMDGLSADANDKVDITPAIVGDWYMPLEEFNSVEYRYLIFEDSSYQTPIWQDVKLYYSLVDTFGISYSFSGEKNKIVLRNYTKDESNSGTYAVGTWDGENYSAFEEEVLLFPQFPLNYKKPWKLWNGATMELFAKDTLVFLHSFSIEADEISESQTYGHKVNIFKETSSDGSEEIYHFLKRKYGVLAQQKNRDGHLKMWGEIQDINLRNGYYWD